MGPCQAPNVARRAARRTYLAALFMVSLALLAACGTASASSPGPRGATRAASPSTASASPSTGAVKHANLLSGVSCTGGMCVAVGGYYRDPSAEHSLAETWQGTAWKLEPAPDGPRDSWLQAVSCANSTACTAVGSLAMTWNGTTWRRTPVAAEFTDISCTATACLAVGESAANRPVYGEWNGTAWKLGALPEPARDTPSQSTTIASVSCVSASGCVAVGNFVSGVGARPNPRTYRERIVAEFWNGATWRIGPTVNVGKVDQFTAVSCLRTTACMAVGTSAQQYPLAERWNGSKWQVLPMPVPGRDGYTYLTAVSCASATACIAVGDYQGLPIAEMWNGAKWRLQWLPQPPGDNNAARLNAISCAGPTSCVAVGDGGGPTTYAEWFDGITWHLTATQNPA